MKRLEGTTSSTLGGFCRSIVLALAIALGACRGEGPARSVDSTSITTVRAPGAQLATPRIEQGPRGPALVLSEAMERALLAAVPGFTPSSVSDYDPDLQKYATPSEKSALFAAIGDFNGDGRADVAVDGHDATHGYLLVLFTERESIRVFTIQKAPLGSIDQRTGRIDFLVLVPRGVIQADTLDDSEYEKVPVPLEHDAFDLAWFEKASTLYYWRKGRFVNWVTSD